MPETVVKSYDEHDCPTVARLLEDIGTLDPTEVEMRYGPHGSHTIELIYVPTVYRDEGKKFMEVCDFCDQISIDLTKTNANSDICGECRDSGKWDIYLSRKEA